MKDTLGTPAIPPKSSFRRSKDSQPITTLPISFEKNSHRRLAHHNLNPPARTSHTTVPARSLPSPCVPSHKPLLRQPDNGRNTPSLNPHEPRQAPSSHLRQSRGDYSPRPQAHLRPAQAQAQASTRLSKVKRQPQISMRSQILDGTGLGEANLRRESFSISWSEVWAC